MPTIQFRTKKLKETRVLEIRAELQFDKERIAAMRSEQELTLYQLEEELKKIKTEAIKPSLQTNPLLTREVRKQKELSRLKERDIKRAKFNISAIRFSLRTEPVAKKFSELAVDAKKRKIEIVQSKISKVRKRIRQLNAQEKECGKSLRRAEVEEKAMEAAEIVITPFLGKPVSLARSKKEVKEPLIHSRSFVRKEVGRRFSKTREEASRTK